MSVSSIDVGPGTVRLEWLDASPRAVEEAVSDAFAAGAHRVEAHVDPADVADQRVATFAGLRKEGVARGVADREDRIVYARLTTDLPVSEPEGFRSLLNSFLPRKRAIAQMLIRDRQERILLCRLTYKKDWDLPGGVIEVGESPALAVSREVEEELALRIPAGELLLTDWMPPWSGWDDAVCLVFDGGIHDSSILADVVKQEREIRDVEFCTPAQARERCADFTARRIESAISRRSSYVEGGGDG